MLSMRHHVNDGPARWAPLNTISSWPCACPVVSSKSPFRTRFLCFAAHRTRFHRLAFLSCTLLISCAPPPLDSHDPVPWINRSIITRSLSPLCLSLPAAVHPFVFHFSSQTCIIVYHGGLFFHLSIVHGILVSCTFSHMGCFLVWMGCVCSPFRYYVRVVQLIITCYLSSLLLTMEWNI